MSHKYQSDNPWLLDNLRSDTIEYYIVIDIEDISINKWLQNMIKSWIYQNISLILT